MNARVNPARCRVISRTTQLGEVITAELFPQQSCHDLSISRVDSAVILSRVSKAPLASERLVSKTINFPLIAGC